MMLYSNLRSDLKLDDAVHRYWGIKSIFPESFISAVFCQEHSKVAEDFFWYVARGHMVLTLEKF